MKIPKIGWLPIAITVAFFCAELILSDYEYVIYLVMPAYSLMALLIGYRITSLNRQAQLMEAAAYGSLIGVVKFLLALPLIVMGWGPFDIGHMTFGILSIIGIIYYSGLGACGGLLGRSIKGQAN